MAVFENHVPPDSLFDPNGAAGPPADAFDVQFRMPLSLAAYADCLLTEGRRHELADLQGFYEQLVNERIVRRVQEICGYIDGRDPARLAITALVEAGIQGVSPLRPHAHVYVGGTAVGLLDDERGQVDEGWLRQGLFGAVWSLYARSLRDGTAERFGLTWARAHGGVHEIVDPPLADEVAGLERPVCRGLWGPRRLVLADESYLAGCVEDEEIIAHQRAIGMPGAR